MCDEFIIKKIFKCNVFCDMYFINGINTKLSVTFVSDFKVVHFTPFLTLLLLLTLLNLLFISYKKAIDYILEITVKRILSCVYLFIFKAYL